MPKVVNAGFVEVFCPDCGVKVKIDVNAEIVMGVDGRQRLVTEPDMTDMWAHMWTHEDHAG